MITVRYHFSPPAIAFVPLARFIYIHHCGSTCVPNGEGCPTSATEQPFGSDSDDMSAEWDLPPDRRFVFILMSLGVIACPTIDELSLSGGADLAPPEGILADPITEAAPAV